MKLSKGPLNLECRVNRKYLQAERKAVVFVSADIHALEITGAHEASYLDVCLAIDCSGSMAGEKFETAKKAGMHIVDMLRATDYISVIRFADRADVVVPRQQVRNKEEIKRLSLIHI